MAEKTLKRAHGNWVVEDRFWDREKEMELFIEYLEEGAHILLVAQRRIGKTSLMREAARLIEDRFICLQVDLQQSHSAADAIVELSTTTRPHQSLWEKTKGIFSNVLGNMASRLESLQISELSVTLRSGLTEGDWKEKGNQLFAILAASEKPVVVFLDEVPILVNRLLKGNDYQLTPERRQQTDAFMSWLRENSIRHKGKVRLVVTGSIGLEPILRQAGLNATINTFTAFDLSPWTPDTAQGCLLALANTYNVTFQPGAIDQMIEALGLCIPHHVQMFFDYVYKVCKLRNIQEVTKELVLEVYQSEMLSLRGHAELSHLEERLKMVLGPELHPLALILLTEAAVSERLTAEAANLLCQRHFFEEEEKKQSSEVQREILRILEHDGYLQREGDAYAFVSKLLKDWWRTHFGFGYSPIGGRKG